MSNFCGNCGAKVTSENGVCPNCGSRMVSEDSATKRNDDHSSQQFCEVEGKECFPIDDLFWSGIKKKYFTYHGRLNRIQYFKRSCWLLLTSFLVLFAIGSFVMLTGGTEGAANVVINLCSIPVAVAAIMLHIRRFHDLGRSGWCCLLMVIPIVNLLVLLYLFLAPGHYGTNQYGSQP